jgi:hypothetical protein
VVVNALVAMMSNGGEGIALNLQPDFPPSSQSGQAAWSVSAVQTSISPI